MKKGIIYSLILVFAVIFSGLMFILGQTKAEQSGSKKQSESVSMKQSSTSQKKESEAKQQEVIWSDSQNQKLSAFMASWQKKMKQEFAGTYDGQKPNYYGSVFPDVLTNGLLADRVQVGNRKVTLNWNSNGQKTDGIDVVAVASRTDNSMKGVLYLFTIENNQPVVYVTKSNNGGELYFEKTQNAQLQNNFANIYQTR